LGVFWAVSAVIDRINDTVGRGIRWLSLVLVAVTAFDVLMRYAFRTSFVFVQELEWHIFAVLFLVAAGYAHLKGDHVRVDIVYARMVPQKQALVDLVCSLLFLFPTCFLLVRTSIPYVEASLRVLEGSPDPGGLPGRYLLKMAIPAGFLLLGLQGVSELIKHVAALRGDRARS
jgi:TRAP-type mannitol/chloroaromatic compound transport system permease small subunit